VEEYTEELGGSKAGMHAYLDDAHPEFHEHLIGRWHYWEPGDDIETFLDRISDFDKPKIVRFCHRNDIVGLIDTISSPVVTGRLQVAKRIRQLAQLVEYEDFQRYYQYEFGEKFDGKYGVLVQDYSDRSAGSVMEHPHYPGIYLFSISQFEAMVDENGMRIEENYDKDRPEWLDVESRMDRKDWDYQSYSAIVIEMYRKFLDTGIFPTNISPQVEFTLIGGTAKFLQARYGRKCEPFDRENNAWAEMNKIRERTRDKTYSSFLYSFGLLPHEGVETTLTELGKVPVNNHSHRDNVAYLGNHEWFSMVESNPLGMDLYPENMFAYLPVQVPAMPHYHFRWMQKADIAMVGAGVLLHHKIFSESLITPEELINGVRVRIYSNGIIGGVNVL